MGANAVQNTFSQPFDFSRVGRRITVTLLAAQSLGSAGFIAANTVNTLAGAQLSGSPALAGVPPAIYQLGAALAAFGWGYGMERLGRRGALALGLMLGTVGAGLAAAALLVRSFLFFCLGLALLGAANSAMQLARFAAAEVYPPQARGRAISNVVLGGTVGAVVGPLLVGPTGRWAAANGLDELGGPYLATLVLLFLAGLVIFAWLRPDPRDVGRALAQLHPEIHGESGRRRPLSQLLRQRPVIAAMSAMVIGQAVMVMLMIITSLHMKGHHHELTDISLVISSHTFGMFAFSVLSGRLADRWGRRPVILIGAVTLALACLTAPLSPEVLPLAVSLFFLGLGWNFCYVGGSSLLADQLSQAERAQTQGFNDLLIGLSAAAGSLGSGVVFAALGYGAMGIVGAGLAVIPIILALSLRQKS